MTIRIRNTLLVGSSIAIVAVAAVILYMASRPGITPTKYAEAVRTPASETCLKSNPAVTVPAGVRNSIELSAISYLMDVPAGTNVDVKLASYSTQHVTGSDQYPAKFGSYNFVMNKQRGDWIITDFKHCK
jgi:hypothetical protein